MAAVLSTARQGRELVDPELFGRLAARVAAEHPGVDSEPAERIVDQAMAFLAAVAVNPGEGLSPSKLVDLGWHQLILSTKDYAALCDRLGGGFIHHVPDDAPGGSPAPGGVRRTIRAIEAAGYVIDHDLWPLKAKCGSCHEDGNCSNSGSDGNENSETRKKKLGRVPMRWDELPQAVRDVVEQHLGPVASAGEITTGSASDVCAVLHLVSDERVFLKGVAGISRRMRWLRNEIAGSQAAEPIAPRVLFHADIDATIAGGDWLLVGHEYVPGRPASLEPGSPDLPLIATAVERIATMPATDLRPLRDRWAPTDWWIKLAEIAPEIVDGWDIEEMIRLTGLVPALVDGDRLLHTDLHGDQFIVGTDEPTRVIDWGFPGAGAPWVDTAFMILRLIEAGHTPDDAETWARARDTFIDIDDQTLTAFAVYLAGFWTHIAVIGGPGSPRRAALARDYAAWRLIRQPMRASKITCRAQR